MQTADQPTTDLRKVLPGLLLALLLAMLDSTIVSAALPTISGDLGGFHLLSWVVVAYLLTSTVTTPLWGKLSDLFGRKHLLQGAVVIFIVGSVLSGLSTSMGMLITFRALQGIGAGGLGVGVIRRPGRRRSTPAFGRRHLGAVPPAGALSRSKRVGRGEQSPRPTLIRWTD